MAAIRILQRGRLVLPDGAKLDADVVWLTQDEARLVADRADFVVHATGLATTDISADRDRIRDLLKRVDGNTGSVAARPYRSTGIVASVLQEFH